MQQNSFLLYGANGYTGRLIARYADRYQLKPVLAGRRQAALAPLAEELGLPYRVVDLNDAPALDAVLKEHKVVLHAAGPFHYTASQMAEACLRTGAHYLDINGDIDVFEMLKGYDTAAKERGVMIMPGVGFDVVPTDCLALYLKGKLPDATRLQLAFSTLGGGVSHGTAATMASKLGEGGAIRKEGRIVRVPLGAKGMWVDFGPRRLFVMYTVMVQLLIEQDGTISEIKTLSTHGYGMEEEIVHTMKLSPKWIPAKQNGHTVRAFHKQPVTFVVSSGDKTQEEAPVTLKSGMTLSVAQLQSLPFSRLIKPETGDYTIPISKTTIPADGLTISGAFTTGDNKNVVHEVHFSGSQPNERIRHLIANATSGDIVTIDKRIGTTKEGKEFKMPSLVYFIK